MSINKVVVSGNLTRDPELRRTQSGMVILSFGIAVNDGRRNQSTGEWEEYANFFDCAIFGSRAESLSKILHKGMKVAAEGKLRWSQWERDGAKRSKVTIVVNEVELMSGRRDQHGSDENPPSPQPAAQSASQAAHAAVSASTAFTEEEASVYDDDIPF